ncbi:MAG: 4Fe-4S dicluster domain-containing protein [Dethiobacteria bacterium]|jgi:formate dehydrogenase iron-sulfur subunit|nr:4Fe-4S dicluster domain-containing protein [Bacillota bacterium]NMD32698.1 4Fe-4S dicluster domain-containing protein [Bacillota bacterium]HOB28318.1 4Fe-4S dicluster domain-containing protein [Bacillota bacterium]HPZ41966.1 4Fe-4S dicluster domain-containing protein [Bacillota bacterium]HQD51868.1 4Fe-4S dicluster domain-containing protein [Bacillota bacterium]
MQKTMLIDTSKCTGCRACQAACKQWNQLPAEQTAFNGTYENPANFSPVTWTKIVFNYKDKDANGRVHWLFSKQGCMHCTEAACIKVCPANAIYRTDFGTVRIDPDRCIGCNYCAANCTYQVIGFDRAANVARKCTFCYDRITNGEIPACAKTCPTGAITYGERSELIPLAQQRVQQLQQAGNSEANLYGLEELNGLAMMYVLESNPESYGLIENPRIKLSTHIWDIIFKPVRILVVAAAFFALWVNRGESKKESD